jgi:hypothetical protein
VPGRNLLFFGYAAAIAYRRDLKRLVGGMCEIDSVARLVCQVDPKETVRNKERHHRLHRLEPVSLPFQIWMQSFQFCPKLRHSQGKMHTMRSPNL